MSIPMEVLAAEALALPAQERSELVERLLASFDGGFDPAWEQAWADEIDRREAAIASGRATWISGIQLLARLRSRLT